MSILSLCMDEINNAKRPQLIETTEEVKLRLTDFRQGINKNGHAYVLFTLSAPELPDTKGFTMYMPEMHEAMPAEERKKTARKWKQFLDAFALSPEDGNINLSDIIGLEAWGIVGIEQPKAGQEQYGPSNYLKKFII